MLLEKDMKVKTGETEYSAKFEVGEVRVFARLYASCPVLALHGADETYLCTITVSRVSELMAYRFDDKAKILAEIIEEIEDLGHVAQRRADGFAFVVERLVEAGITVEVV